MTMTRSTWWSKTGHLMKSSEAQDKKRKRLKSHCPLEGHVLNDLKTSH
jgi:hypothetical protein